MRRRVLVTLLVIATVTSVVIAASSSVFSFVWLEHVEEATPYGIVGTRVFTRKRWGQNRGKKHGVQRMFEEGVLVSEATFDDGNIEGWWTHWEQGKISQQRLIRNGERVATVLAPPWRAGKRDLDRVDGPIEVKLRDKVIAFGLLRDGKAVGVWTWVHGLGVYQRQQVLDQSGAFVDDRHAPPWWPVPEEFATSQAASR